NTNTPAGSSLFCINHEGDVAQQIQLPAPIQKEIAVSNLFNTIHPNIIFYDEANTLHILNELLEYEEGFPLQIEANINTALISASVINTAGKDIIFGDDFGFLHIVNNTGQYHNGHPRKITNSFSGFPFVGNFDDNDSADIMMGNGRVVEFYDTQKTVGEIGWNTYRGNNGNTACILFPTEEVDETDIILPNYTNYLKQNYPNPFNPDTVIEFIIAKSETIRLDIFNVKGQKVKLLLDEHRNVGQHSVKWDGKDDSGQSVGSGIYFYKLESNSFTFIKKMVLMK
ncbi:MAG: T9SS type A sorting domain-containing protein, partial [Candidatus Cloacimonetes bacterium]|nr:T9SS type A sorting domain-containing protein [Candidatus Cloacimonadota bacterium]